MAPQDTSESKLNVGLVELDIPTVSFAALYGKRSGSYINQALSGVTKLKEGEAHEMLALLQELHELAESVAPLPINFRNASVIAPILEQHRARKRASLPQSFHVHVTGENTPGAYFHSLSRFGKVMSIAYPAGAPAMVEGVAEQLISKLEAVGLHGKQIPARGVDFVHESLSTLWPES
jgi:hypothetical protein